jgi:hypothetical protein
MNEKARSQGYELFEQAIKNYEQALQAGLKLQQESAQWWMDLMKQGGSPQDWQAKVNAVAAESLSVAQKRMEENLKLVEHSSRTSMDLLKKAMDAMKTDTVLAGQTKLQELWESSLEAVRGNAAAIGEANAKWVESWMHMMPKAKAAGSAKVTTA